MSIVQLLAAPERARVAVDSAGTRLAGGAFVGVKLLVLPPDMVLACRGNFDTHLRLGWSLLAAGLPLSFDGTSEALPDLIAGVQPGLPGSPESETYLLGWSERAGRFQAAVFVVDADGRISRTERLGDAPGEISASFAPWECATAPPCQPTDDASCLRLGRMQAATWRANRSMAVGGPLVRAELVRVDGRTRVEVATLGEL